MTEARTAAELITVRVLKYDGSEHRRWQARLSREEDNLLVLEGVFESAVDHSLLGHIKQGTRTIEFYWLYRWYNVFEFLDDDGRTRLWYCNVNTPPSLVDGVLSYVDLDIDVLVQPDLSYEVIDLDEFKENTQSLAYPPESVTAARNAVRELISLIEARQFPFSGLRVNSREPFGLAR